MAELDSMPPTLDSSLSTEDWYSLLDQFPTYVAVHRPIFDAAGSIVDARLEWYNHHFRDLFVHPPVIGQSMMESYADPGIALDFVRMAWNGEDATQEFVVDERILEWYAGIDKSVTFLLRWSRFGDRIAEIGLDRTEFLEARRDLANSNLELLDSWRIQEIARSRQELARDMHDSVIQRLLAVGMGIRRVLKTLDVPDNARHQAEIVVTNIDETIVELRSIVETLKFREGNSTSAADLNSTLLDIFRSMSPMLGHQPSYTTNLACSLPSHACRDIEAVVRESLANVAKHAGAKRSYVRVECDRSTLTVRVLDDGIGFDPDAPLGDGLPNLEARATRYGGRLEVTARHDRPGTRVEWVIPCPEG